MYIMDEVCLIFIANDVVTTFMFGDINFTKRTHLCRFCNPQKLG